MQNTNTLTQKRKALTQAKDNIAMQRERKQTFQQFSQEIKRRTPISIILWFCLILHF